MATFTGQTEGKGSYGWSFGLGWASFPLFLMTGALAFLLDGTDQAAYIDATRTFMFFAVIAGVISCICLCGNFFSFQLRSISKTKSSAIASLVAALCVMIGMAIFTGQTGGIAPYGWSFGLGWATFPLFLITGGLAFALDRTVSTAA
ncbi:protein NKG7-like [Podarcis lilfordi]|uniref:Protein NKG7-like n=1 Tax=Podarcis lilfordi TaxID=74358 RepID=A0AA35PDD0_9SAUR|nr:protein NKG7-like [Podarcis lilfordi]